MPASDDGVLKHPPSPSRRVADGDAPVATLRVPALQPTLPPMPQQPGNAPKPTVVGVDLSGGRLEVLQQRREMLSQAYQDVMVERGRVGQERMNAQARGDAGMVKEYDATIERLGARLQQLERSRQVADSKIDEAMNAPLAVTATAPGEAGTTTTVQPVVPDVASLLIAERLQSNKVMMIGGTGLLLLAAILWRVGYQRGLRVARAALQPATAAPRDDERLMQAVDAIAIEVERLSEGQRFLSNLMAARRPERSELPAPPRLVTTPSEGSRITPH